MTIVQHEYNKIANKNGRALTLAEMVPLLLRHDPFFVVLVVSGIVSILVCIILTV